MDEQQVGQVTHYFDKIGVIAMKLEQPLAVGDTIHVKGATTDFDQTVESIQVNKENITQANAGEEVGIKSIKPAREGDIVYKSQAE